MDRERPSEPTAELDGAAAQSLLAGLRQLG